MERYKVWLVAKGYIQQEGIDFLDTFSPVAKLTFVRILRVVVATRNWFLHQLDVDNAFLHGDLKDDVYMEVPLGLDTNIKGQKTPTDFTALLVYVDDIVLAGNSIDEITHIKDLLHRQFQIKDLEELKYFLGFEVARSKKGIHLHKRKYALDILEETGMMGSKPCSTPFLSNTHSLYKMEKYMENPSAYRRLIGKLFYLTNTRPDLCFTVNLISQFMQESTDYHYQALQHILRYVKSSPSEGLFFAANSDIQIKGFNDSNWATCPNTRRSTTGYCVFLGSSLWLHYLLEDLQIQPTTVVLYYDNNSAKHITHNQSFHERTKHIDLDFHVVREKIQAKFLYLLPIRSEEQLTDVITKFPHRTRFKSIVPKLGLVNTHHPA
ncbi:uncharacterized protein LOC106779872 [Vigna radiata var. radiata]|uniref:Uncharacterized protein LOC106779872 n=1 Tax=Vigna radiata var. radiata TaxID=3916 RepID=A0A1S3VZ13_VIGRR|nr:uncharacterized protein LOC106779872 [Vigna radiata var. radiata]